MFIMSVDLGQATDFTAISILERKDVMVNKPKPHTEHTYDLRYLERPPLGTKYTAIVAQVIALLDRAPLDRRTTPLVVDRTGVGRAVVDQFTAAGLRPHAITITGGDAVNKEDIFDIRVPKRELASTLVTVYQTQRLKTAAGLALAPILTNELLGFKVKINLATGNDSYEAWRESIHDDLVLSVAMGVWYGETFRSSTGPSVVWAGRRTIIMPHTLDGRRPGPIMPPTMGRHPSSRQATQDLLRLPNKRP